MGSRADEHNFSKNDRNVVAVPTEYMAYRDQRAILTKTPPTNTFGSYSSTYAQNQVINHGEYGYAQGGKAYELATTNVAAGGRNTMSGWVLACNTYDTAGTDTNAIINLWTSGLYELDFSVNTDTFPNSITYADCAWRFYGTGGGFTDNTTGCDRNSGSAIEWGLPLRGHRMIFIDDTSVNAVAPVIHVNTATSPFPVYYGWFQVKLIYSTERYNTNV